MRLLPRSLKWRTVLLTLLGLATVGVSVWWAFRDPLSTYANRQRALAELRSSRHAEVRDLAAGRFGPDTPFDDLLAAHPCPVVVRYDRFAYAQYEASGLTVLAVDGRVRRAQTMGDGCHTIFNTLTPAEHAANHRELVNSCAEAEGRWHSAFGAAAGGAAVGTFPIWGAADR